MNRTIEFPMSWAVQPDRRFQWLLTALSAAGLLATTASVWLIWLFLTQPVQVARVVDQGGPREAARLLASAVYALVVKVLAWL